MNFLKLATLVAVASLPLLLLRKGKDEGAPQQEVDSDHIFDEELKPE